MVSSEDLSATDSSPAPEQEQDSPDARKRRQRRNLLMALAGGALIALLAPLLLWANYRSTHVVCRDAVVRGHIAEIGARLDGIVERVEVDAGDRVEAGQVVARLQDGHFEAKVRQASSQLEKARREREVELLAIANERLRLQSALRGESAGASAASAELRAARSRAEEALRRVEIQRSLVRIDAGPGE